MEKEAGWGYYYLGPVLYNIRDQASKEYAKDLLVGGP
jgi:hypothetical protein